MIEEFLTQKEAMIALVAGKTLCDERGCLVILVHHGISVRAPDAQHGTPYRGNLSRLTLYEEPIFTFLEAVKMLFEGEAEVFERSRETTMILNSGDELEFSDAGTKLDHQQVDLYDYNAQWKKVR